MQITENYAKEEGTSPVRGFIQHLKENAIAYIKDLRERPKWHLKTSGKNLLPIFYSLDMRKRSKQLAGLENMEEVRELCTFNRQYGVGYEIIQVLLWYFAREAFNLGLYHTGACCILVPTALKYIETCAIDCTTRSAAKKGAAGGEIELPEQESPIINIESNLEERLQTAAVC